MMRSGSCLLLSIIFTATFFLSGSADDPPSDFSLLYYNGNNYVTSIKSQKGGTCWAHGTMASMESNLLVTGNWAAAGDTGEPNLAEYHLDWWNGFNQYNNDDIVPFDSSGLEVHYGGDYLVASAYLTRGEGAVRDIDGQWYDPAPPRYYPGFHIYYPRDIEWFALDEEMSNMDVLKTAIMTHGAVGTAMYISNDFYSQEYNCYYQPPDDQTPPNHAVTIIGWCDRQQTQAPLPGAWQIKNSWGGSSYFWLSYYDKWCAKKPDMGFVSFHNVELLKYNQIYYHDYHGWRANKTNCCEAFNAFMAHGGEILEAVSFYTTEDSVDYIVRVYDSFENGELLDLMAEKSGFIEFKGFHTIDLDTPLEIVYKDDRFYIYLNVSNCCQAYDKTSDVQLLLGGEGRPRIESTAGPDQSYYYGTYGWSDLYQTSRTSNFCIKGLSNIAVTFDYDTSVGCPPLDVSFESSSTLDVDEWIWDFGNGDSAFTQNAVSTYKDGGNYDVSLEVISGDSTRQVIKQKSILILEDSLFGGYANGGPGSSVEMTISSYNTLPLIGVKIPICYAGPIDLTLDSFSTTGCLTENFGHAKMSSYDPFNKRACFSIMNTGDSTCNIEPGFGPVMKLYFSIPETASTDDTLSMTFEPYASNTPLFISDRLNYQPLCYCGFVSVDVCGDADGDYAINILDVTFIINYLYKNGPQPKLNNVDVDGNGSVSILDVSYLINYLYKDGPEPDCP